MAKYVTTINTKGAFFAKDPGLTFRDNIKKLMDELAAQGEADVKAQLRAGESGRFPLGGRIVPGRVSGHVHGRTHNLAGKRWEVTAIISVNNRGFTKAQGTKLMAAHGWLESQGHAFRRTAGRLRRARAVNMTELLKGIR
jgi:hypothetical protein